MTNSKVESGYMSVSHREKRNVAGEYSDVIAIRIVNEDHHFVMDIEIDPADYGRATTGLVVKCKMIKEE